MHVHIAYSSPSSCNHGAALCQFTLLHVILLSTTSFDSALSRSSNHLEPFISFLLNLKRSDHRWSTPKSRSDRNPITKYSQGFRGKTRRLGHAKKNLRAMSFSFSFPFFCCFRDRFALLFCCAAVLICNNSDFFFRQKHTFSRDQHRFFCSIRDFSRLRPFRLPAQTNNTSTLSPVPQN